MNRPTRTRRSRWRGRCKARLGVSDNAAKSAASLLGASSWRTCPAPADRRTERQRARPGALQRHVAKDRRGDRRRTADAASWEKSVTRAPSCMGPSKGMGGGGALTRPYLAAMSPANHLTWPLPSAKIGCSIAYLGLPYLWRGQPMAKWGGQLPGRWKASLESQVSAGTACGTTFLVAASPPETDRAAFTPPGAMSAGGILHWHGTSRQLACRMERSRPYTPVDRSGILPAPGMAGG